MAPLTAAVAADVAVVDPPGFRAVTLTRSVPPLSDDVSRYVPAPAPEIDAQFAPWVSQRDQL